MKKIVLILLLILFLTPIASAIPANLTAEIGSNYIQWSWNNTNSSQIAIFIDNSFIRNTTYNSTILSDLNPREKHSIILANASNTSQIWLQDTERTFYPPVLFYILFIFLSTFFILSFIMNEEIKTYIFGGVTFSLGLLCYYLSYPFYFTILSYLCLIIVALIIIWLIAVTVALFGRKENPEEI